MKQFVDRKQVDRRAAQLPMEAEDCRHGEHHHDPSGGNRSDAKQHPMSRIYSVDDLSLDSDRRWAIRRQVGLDAHVTDSEGQSHQAVVINISEDGCGILIQTGVELVRERLHTIAIRSIEPLAAYVIWSKDGQAGLALAEPLHLTVVQRLVVKSLYGKIGRRLAGHDRP